MKKTKILVTGGSGFIGHHLISELLKNNFYVKSLDKIKDNSINNKNYKFYKGNLFDVNLLGKILKNCDLVIHLAAYLGVEKTDKNILNCLDNNILATRNLLRICNENKIKKFIFASSSEVYGDQKKFPLFENFETQNKTIYGISKIVGEKYIKGFFQKYKLDYNIIRFFNVYGPGQNNNFVISKYIQRIKKNKPLEVYGNGTQIRSFCYIEDAISGVMNIIYRGKKNTTYNIGNDKEPISILKLTKLIKSICKKKIIVKKVDFKHSDRKKEREIFKRIPSIEKISKDTGYSPRISLTDGILKIINDRKLIKKSMLKKYLGIGTLQFGLNYGVANKTGKISNGEIKKIKNILLKNNINTIDTAHAYGDSEKRIGKFDFSNFEIITKLPVKEPKNLSKNWVVRCVRDSLIKLNVKKIYCMHVHNTKQLLKNNGKIIYEGLLQAKKEGLINKIGVSIYTIEELNKIITKFNIDLALIPFNIFDQRTLKNNYLEKLKNKKIEIHARSIFLQGLLVMSRNSIPNKFNIYDGYFSRWNKLIKKHKINKYSACLNYVLSNKNIDKAIVGIDNSSHLKSLVMSLDHFNIPIENVDASKEIKLINPSKW